MKKRIAVLSLLLLAILLAAHPGAAQEPVDPTREGPPPRPPQPPIWNVDGLTIDYQRVDVTIDRQVATTHVEQLFVNDNDWILEGTYLFPLPPGAAVNELTMWVDGEPIEAKILEADEARAIYDEIVRQVRDPALLEYVGANAIQASVFPIPPHDERRIEIEYSQVLPAENGLINYVYPQSTDLYTETPLESQSIRVEVTSQEAIRAIYSPSHSVAVSRQGEFRAVVGYEEDNVTPRQDFELFYSVTPEEIGLNLLSYKEAEEDGFFLMLVAPDVEVDPAEVVAKDVMLVLDTSGSMEGQKLAQAKEAAHYVLDNLNPGDRFNVVSFSTGVRSFTPQMAPAADAGDAHAFVDRLEALGGTNISRALLEALQQADPERPLTLLFLTDGLATEGVVETPLLLDAVAEAAPASARLFAFGVGHDVDTLLLDSLAENHRGSTTYVRSDQAIDEAVGGFYAKVSTPVLANVNLTVDGVTVEQLYPHELPDLFAGTQLVVTGRYRRGGPATVTIDGEVNGQQQQFVYEDVSFRERGGQSFIPRLWATRAIGNLLREIRLHGENDELLRSVVDLSIRYGIITPYTSFLIEEDDIFTQTGRQTMVEESMEAAAEPAPVSGAEAVEEAAQQGAMADADAAAPLPTTAAEPGGETGTGSVTAPVQTVGSKTFVYRDGVWMDTAYDAGGETPQQIGFASDTYFELLSAAPELGRYLALGPRLIVVYDGLTYEIVEGEGESDVSLPAATPRDGDPQNNPNPPAPDSADTPESGDGDQADVAQSGGSLLCAAGLLLPLFLGTLAIVGGRRRYHQV